ncbi:uncharacterized protein PV06_02207 [Exophiala oligosperma]|uniref:Uncharacterized protein n=2 Tax=Chaetothyriales TaxID=34395 RepID=A0A0D2EF42_9EURO|nr:uncharacterized protein PV06_02207 [Exophiala oligosperma]KAJ9629077.1 hypothetical protein H2204_009017 [Knufia peltigerae]KIW46539.1 hypothetical protein PV06_02207 [Exophiala oligosperma]
MQPILRLASRTPRTPHVLRQAGVFYAAQPRRLAHQDYGSEQSGMEQGRDQKNPKSHLEHPGPEAPANMGTASSSGSSQAQSTEKSDTGSDRGSPAIHRPESAAEKDNPEVRKHNEEMEQRHERSVNQLAEEDNKVDKKFWQGDVGPKSAGNSSDQNAAGGQ